MRKEMNACRDGRLPVSIKEKMTINKNVIAKYGRKSIHSRITGNLSSIVNPRR
jgi:hypothetical protein